MRKLALFTAGFAGAAGLYVYLICDARALWLALICLILLSVCLFLGLKRSSVVFLGLLAGFIWCFGYDLLWMEPAGSLCDTEQTLSVVVLEKPSVTYYGSGAEVELTLDGRTYGAILYAGEDLLEAEPGDTVTCTVQIETALSDEKDGYFYHQANGTVLLLRTNETVKIQKGIPPWYIQLRLWFQDRIHGLYDEKVSPLLLALLTGDQGELSYATRNELSIAGLSHTVAVSGLHVSVLIAALALLFGYNPRLTALFGIPLSVSFVLMTGASASACRSAVMQIIMLAAPLIRREQDSWTSLSAAAVLLLLKNPWAIAGVGFQLSFTAVMGLLLFSGPMQKRLLARKKKPGRLYRMAVSGIAACLSATVATLPLTVYYFGMISICAVATNLLVLPVMSVLLILGLVSCLLGAIPAMLVSILSKYVLWVAHTAAKFPFAAAYEQDLPFMIWAAGAYILAIILLLWRKESSRWIPVGVVSTLIACILWGTWNYGYGTPIYRVLDVGQGQCILLETGDLTAVVDCGGSNPQWIGEQTARTLNSAGRTHVNVVAITHYDSDHAGGVPQFLRRIRTDLVLLPDVADEKGLRQEIEAAAVETGAQVMEVTDLTSIDFPNGSLTIYPSLSKKTENNAGICVLATVEEYDMLITGDLNHTAELRLLTEFDIPKADVLVAGHHGAASSTSSILLKTVKPELVVVSAAKDNPFGHPSEETLKRIEAVGAEVICTGQAGDIVIRRR